MSGGALCAMDEGGRSRVHWLKNQRVDADCHRTNQAVRRMARRALFLRFIKKKRAAFFLKSMRCGRSNPRENE